MSQSLTIEFLLLRVDFLVGLVDGGLARHGYAPVVEHLLRQRDGLRPRHRRRSDRLALWGRSDCGARSAIDLFVRSRLETS